MTGDTIHGLTKTGTCGHRTVMALGLDRLLPDMIISHDGTTQVMTRLHSEFDSMVQQEQERAILVFDSKSIQSVPGEPFSYEFNEIIPRHLMNPYLKGWNSKRF